LAGNVLDTIQVRIRREMNDLLDDMGGGSALTADDIAVAHAKDVGVIEGLARAERAILDVLEDIEKQEKLDT
jgi:hypothetical protein